MTIKQFCSARQITAKAEYADSNPNMPDSKNMNHWRVTLHRHEGGTKGRAQMTIHYSTGYGISGEPQAADVLYCLISDASGYDCARSFEDWAAEYGYDTDSRKAERIYHAVERQTAKLKAFLGPHYKAAFACEE